MAVKIKLRRVGKRNAGSHRIVVIDSRRPRDGNYIEKVGMYDPRHKNEKIDLERVNYWLSVGAQPSDTVSAIINRARAGVPMGSERAERNSNSSGPGERSSGTESRDASEAPKETEN